MTNWTFSPNAEGKVTFLKIFFRILIFKKFLNNRILKYFLEIFFAEFYSLFLELLLNIFIEFLQLFFLFFFPRETICFSNT